MTMQHDDPELRARVRAELLSPVARPCDYVKHRTAANARACEKCGASAWDVCYDTFLCDACVKALDAEMNEHARKLASAQPVRPAERMGWG